MTDTNLNETGSGARYMQTPNNVYLPNKGSCIDMFAKIDQMFSHSARY